MPNADATVTDLHDEIARLREEVRAASGDPGRLVASTSGHSWSWRHRSKPAIRYLLAVVFVGAALTMTVAFKDTVRAAHFSTPFFFGAIVLSSWLGGQGCGLCATLLSLVCLGTFFPYDQHRFEFTGEDIPRFAVFLLVGGFISWLGGRQRRDEIALLRIRGELEEKVRLRTQDLLETNEKLRTEVAERILQKARAEERTESVMRANRTIPASLSNLGDTNNFDRLLGEVLSVIVEYLGEEGGGLWLYDAEQDRLRLQVVFEEGKIKPAHRADPPGAVSSEGEALAEETDGSSSLLSLFKDNIVTVFRPDDAVMQRHFAAYRQTLRARGIRSLLGIPLLAGEEFLGMISVRRKEDGRHSNDEIAFVQAIAIHAALVLKMSRLAEMERKAALADERNRMAGEMHDTLAQSFAATLLHLRSMDMNDVSPELQTHWKFAQDNAAQGLAAARRAMNSMRSAEPTDGRTLAVRVGERVRQVSARVGDRTKVRFLERGEAAALPWAVEAELERLAGEALFNAERHAAAREIAVELDYLPDGLCLRVRDDGRGFDQAETMGDGLGLRSMQERADRIGASFTLITEAGRGTEIVVLWNGQPVHPAPETSAPENDL